MYVCVWGWVEEINEIQILKIIYVYIYAWVREVSILRLLWKRGEGIIGWGIDKRIRNMM